MKTRLLFMISRFLDGGIDTILTEYLRNIPLDRYDVTLAIGTAIWRCTAPVFPRV